MSQTLPVGVPATFTVVVVSGTHVNYKWLFNGTNYIPSANGASYTIAQVGLADAGDYSVEVRNSGGMVLSSNASLRVVSATPRIVEASPGMKGFDLRVIGAVGTCTTFASTNLSLWVPIATNIAPSGEFLFTDTSASDFPARYYRIQVQ